MPRDAHTLVTLLPAVQPASPTQHVHLSRLPPDPIFSRKCPTNKCPGLDFPFKMSALREALSETPIRDSRLVRWGRCDRWQCVQKGLSTCVQGHVLRDTEFVSENQISRSQTQGPRTVTLRTMGHSEQEDTTFFLLWDLTWAVSENSISFANCHDYYDQFVTETEMTVTFQ